ncbi:hypothetical protein EIN_058740 [Entamoeba invadens IP1]|uniref:hypothetical protein n=1 Tax=Entamoeba invadens IP1 TaxID=370355 RepID=UPI0002C3DF4F|nr:hypothetical protein EIN_058740 [Entamoeba invadens IP1]ELP93419.1 hypothetical protein EIN_058740 [Entamoeba invadens IP1]|eukprot:XP_004260190.1 hypothetical protein EIN_058740 [Entamoeba invadens IP1]
MIPKSKVKVVNPIVKKAKTTLDHSMGSRSSLGKISPVPEMASSNTETSSSLPQSSYPPTTLFYQYDTDGFDELTVQQIRLFLQEEKGLYLTDDYIQSMISNVLMQTDKIKVTDFEKLNSFINENAKTLAEQSSLFNTPENRHDLSLYPQQHDFDRMAKTMGDRNFAHETQSEQDVINECVNLTTKDKVDGKDLIVKDVNIIHQEKPHLSNETIDDALKGISFKDLPPFQKSVLNMIFGKTTEIQKRKIAFEKVVPEEYADPLLQCGEDNTTEDTPNINILRDDAAKQTSTRQIYRNLFDQYDQTFDPIDDREVLCGKREISLINPHEFQCDVWMFEIPQLKSGKDCPNDKIHGVFSLYDITMDRKLIENFYVDFPIDKRNSTKDSVCMCVNWMDRVFKRGEHKIKAVLMLYKSAEIDVYSARDAYLKDDKKKKSQGDKDNSKKTTNYKQFLGIGVCDVGEIMTGTETTYSTKDLPIYREDIDKKSDLDAFLKSEPKSKIMNLTWGFSLKKIIKKEDRESFINGDNSKKQFIQSDYTLKDPSGYVVRNSPPNAKVIRMMESFMSIENYKNFFLDFTNNVYISPRELNLVSLSPKDRKKTKFLITCYFRCSDRELNPSSCMEVFYSKTHEDKFVSSVTTTVSIGNKVDYYLDEFKVKLPVNLNDQHHFFFLIEDVTFPDEQKRDTAKYFAYRPIFEGGKLIDNMEHPLKVYTENGITGYMTSTDKQEDCVGEKKSTLKVNIDIQSSIFAQNKTLFELLEKVSTDYSVEDIEPLLNNLKTVTVVQIVHFFPVIMQNLFCLFSEKKKIETTQTPPLEKKEEPKKEATSSGRLDDKPEVLNTPRNFESPTKKTRMSKSEVHNTDIVFISILKVLSAMTREEKVKVDGSQVRQRNHILASYVDYYYTNGEDNEEKSDNIPVFQKLVSSMLFYFEKLMGLSQVIPSNTVAVASEQDDQRIALAPVAIEYCWFFLDIIIKSLTLYLDKMSIFDSSNRIEKLRQLGEDAIFSKFNNNVIKLSSVLARVVRIRLSKNVPETDGLFYLNADFALFVNDLVRVYTPSIGFSVMSTYVTILSRLLDLQTKTYFIPFVSPPMQPPLNDSTLFKPGKDMVNMCWQAIQLLRIDFLNVLSSYQYFYELNIPLLIKSDTIQSVGELRSILNERHFFANAIENSLMDMMSRNDNVSKYALFVFLKRVIMCDVDKRFAKKKEQIAQFFLPFLLDFIDNFDRLSSVWGVDSKQFETQDFYLCAIWVLKNVNMQLLQKYVSCEVTSKVLNFIRLLSSAKDILSKLPTKISEDDRANYRRVGKKCLTTRNVLTVEYMDKFKVSDNEKARLQMMVVEPLVKNEEKTGEKMPRQPVKYEKGIQETLMFGPSPGLGNGTMFVKRTAKLEKMLGFSKTVAEYIQRNPIQDNVIYDDVLLVILDVVDCLFDCLFVNKDVDEMKEICDFISNKLFVANPPAQYIKRFFQFIRKTVRTKGEYLFKTNLDFTYNLLRGIISYCNVNDIDIRTDATSVLYLFVKTNHEILKNTECMKIQVVAALASMDSVKDAALNGDRVEKMDKFKRALNTLEQWAKLDFSQERFFGKQEELTRGKDSSNDIVDANAYETYRANVFNRRMDLMKNVESDESGGDRKWITKDRVIKQLLNLWKSDEVAAITKFGEDLLKTFEPKVKTEQSIETLKINTLHFLGDVLEKVRNCVGFSGEHSIPNEKYKTLALGKTKEVDAKLEEYRKMIEEFKKVEADIIIPVEELEETVNLTKELLGLRSIIEDAEKNEKQKRENMKKEFDDELKKTSDALVKTFNDTCQSMKLKDGNDLQSLAGPQMQLSQTITKLNILTEEAKKAHERFIKKEAEVMAVSPWSVVFKNWNNVLPMGVKILESVTMLQNQLNDYEKNMLSESEQMDNELSASEELVKYYAWEIGVKDVVEFVSGSSNTEPILLAAGKLSQRFKSVQASYDIVQKLYKKDTNQGKSFKMFTKFVGSLTPPIQLKNDLMAHFRTLNKDSQKEKANEEQRKEYAQCFSIAVQLLEFQTDEPGQQFVDLSKQIKSIESLKIPNFDKYVKKEDIEKLKKFVETNMKFNIILPSENKIEKEKPAADNNNEDSVSKRESFMKYLGLLKNHIEEFLKDLSDLTQLKESNGSALDLILERKLQIANKYVDCPQIFIPWYQMIADQQNSRNFFAEAAVGKVYIAMFIYNAIKDSIHPLNIDLLKTITRDNVEYDQPSFQSGATSLNPETLVETIKSGADLFGSAHMNTFSISLYNFIIPYFISNKNYSALSSAHERVNQLYSVISDVPVFFFYQVGFYGRDFFGKDHQQKYIYLSPFRVKEFSSQICQMHKKKINGIDVAPDYKQEMENDDPTSPYVAIESVNTFSNGRGQQKLGVNFQGSNTFVFEKPVFDQKTKGYEGMSKLITIYKTEHFMPSVLEREKIIDVQRKTKTPIECVIDDVENRLEALNKSIEEFKNKTISIVSFQPALKGILVADVNGGFEVICSTFLKYPNIEKYDIEHVNNLNTILQRMMFLCKTGLTLHKSNMKQEQAGMQSIFDRGFLATSKVIRDVKGDIIEYAKKCQRDDILEQLN